MRLVGLDPIRVLIIGSGLAVGYGVSAHRDALTGGLAQAIQNDGSRGVIVQNTASPVQSLERTVQSLSGVGATSFHQVVWCPSLFDLFRVPDRGRYQRTLSEGIQLIRDTARPGAKVTICELPSPMNRGPIEDIARSQLPQFNTALRRAVAAFQSVVVSESPSFTSLRDPNAFSGGYYHTWAEWIIRPESACESRTA